MKAKQKLRRFLCILLACMMVLNAPMSAMAFEDVQILDVVEDTETVVEEAFASEDMLFTDEENVVELAEEPQEQVLDNSSEELNLFEDENPEFGENIEIIGIEEVVVEDTLELFSDGSVTGEQDGNSIALEGNADISSIVISEAKVKDYTINTEENRITVELAEETELDAEVKVQLTVASDFLALDPLSMDGYGTFSRTNLLMGVAGTLTEAGKATLANGKGGFAFKANNVEYYIDFSVDGTVEAVVNQEKASAVAEVITALPTTDKLTVADADKVKEARTAYEALTDAQKELVSADTLKQLEAAEAKMEELTHIHSWDAGTVTKEATCKETGVKTYTCTETVNGESCGQTKTETVAKSTKHSYGEWETVSAATVFQTEVQRHICSVCGKSETKNVGKALKAVLELPGEIKGIYLKEGNAVTFAISMANGDKISSAVSSNSNILKIGAVAKKSGKIRMKGVKSGTTKLKITLASGKTRTYTVKVVSGQVKTKQLTIPNVTDKKLTLKKGKTFALEAVRVPFTSTQKVTYVSSNTNVATVTSSGEVKAMGVGTAVITAASGSKKVKITVTVPGITNVKSSVSVNKNKTLTLKPTTYGISGKVTYSSSNTNIATVTSKGKIKGIKKGTATITIKAGNFKKTVKVTVK